jgi:hypothetical protein
MATPKKNTPRKPATKFPQLQKKLNQLSAASQRSKKIPNVHQGRRGLQGGRG